MPAPSSQLTSSLLSTASGLVSYAQGQIGTANTFVNNIATAVQGLTPPGITPTFPSGGSAPSVSISAPPTFGQIVWYAPGFPAPFTGVLETGDLEIEPFDEDPPELFFGTAPTPFVGSIPDAPGIDLTFEMPELSVSMPAPPDLLSLNVLPFGGMTLPTFDADDPVLTAVEPSIREYNPAATYSSELLDTLRTRLETMVAGGSGLGAEAEEALWNRGREREARSQADSLLQLDQMEELGYMRPPGGYMAARTKIITETDYAARGHSREVMIESARLALDSVKTALSGAIQLEGKLIDYTNSTEQRLFDASRYATEAGIQIYNAKVQAFAAMVDVYRAKVQAFEALIRAETAKVDAYRAQIAAEEAKASINRTLVEQFKVQSDVALSNIRIFEARISAIQTRAEIEKAKVQVFGEQVRGYTAQVNAYTAGVEGFRASIAAEATKQDAFKSKVQVYAARVEAGSKLIDARIAAFRGQIDAKSAEYDGYRAAVTGESARVEGIARSNTVIAESYKALVGAEAARAETLTKQWQATLDQNQRVSEIAVSAAKVNAELYVTTRSLALDAAKAGAQVSAQIGAAAMNAINFSGSVSSSEGYSANESVATSTSTNQSNSTSNSTNYNYNSSV